MDFGAAHLALDPARRFSTVSLRQQSGGAAPCARPLHRASVLRRDGAFLPVLRSELIRRGLSHPATRGIRTHRAPLLCAASAVPEAAAGTCSGGVIAQSARLIDLSMR